MTEDKARLLRSLSIDRTTPEAAPSRRRWPVLVVIAGVVVAAGAGIAVLGRSPDDLAHGIEAADRQGLFLIAAPQGSGA